MLYVLQSLGPGEDVVRVGEFHWLYNVSAAFNIVMGVVIATGILWGSVYLTLNGAIPLVTQPIYVGDGWLVIVRKLHPAIKIAAFLALVFSLLHFAHMMVVRLSTEIAVTTQRLIYKRGLVSRLVGEMNIDRIEGVTVYQSFWGRIFDYGQVIVRGMGVGEVTLPNIAQPIRFRRAIEKARQQTDSKDR